MKLVTIFTLGCLLLACKSEKIGSENQSENDARQIDSNYCDCTELIFDQPYNHFYRFERRKGFTGNCEEFYPSGQLKVSKNYLDGKLHGKLVSYYENGKIHEEKEFDMNFQLGERIIYTNKGEVKFHALYSRGKQDKILVNRPDLVEEDPWAN